MIQLLWDYIERCQCWGGRRINSKGSFQRIYVVPPPNSPETPAPTMLIFMMEIAYAEKLEKDLISLGLRCKCGRWDGEYTGIIITTNWRDLCDFNCKKLIIFPDFDVYLETAYLLDYSENDGSGYDMILEEILRQRLLFNASIIYNYSSYVDLFNRTIEAWLTSNVYSYSYEFTPGEKTNDG